MGNIPTKGDRSPKKQMKILRRRASDTSNRRDSTSSKESDAVRPMEQAPPLKPKNSKAEAVIRQLWDAYSAQDLVEARKFYTPDMVFGFPGGYEIQLNDFFEAMESLQRSFPDMKTTIDEDIVEFAPNRVRITNMIRHGTHTGPAYAFGPYPPIETSGTFVVDSPIDVDYTLTEDLKVKSALIKTKKPGDATGPARFYSSIGGDIWMD